VSSSSALAGTSSDKVPASVMKRQVLERLRTMCDKVDKNARVAQTRYKRYFDHKVHTTPSYNVNEYVYVDLADPRLRPASRRTNESEQLANANRYKLMFKKTGPYRIVAVQSHTVTLDEDGINNTVSMDRISRASRPPPAERPSETADANSNIDNLGANAPSEEMSTSNAPVETPDDVDDGTIPSTSSQLNSPAPPEEVAPDVEPTNTPTEQREYVVDRIISHEGKGRNKKYVVRWYGYAPEHDTVEPPENLPQHFIRRYWRRKRGTNA